MFAFGTETIGFIWVVANPVLVASLVLLPRAGLIHKAGSQSSMRGRRLNLTVGGLCLLLALLNLAIALGFAQDIPLLQAAQAVSASAFWASAFCYAVCAWALLRDSHHGYSK